MESEEGIRWRGNRGGLKDIKIRRSRGIDDDTVTQFGMDGEPVSPLGRLFHEPNFNVHVVAILGSKHKIMPDILKANVPRTLLKHPHISSLMVVDEGDGGKMKWVRTEMDLDKHVVEPTIPNDIESPDKFVEDYIQKLTKSSVEKSKPLWEVHLLNLRTSDAQDPPVAWLAHVCWNFWHKAQ